MVAVLIEKGKALFHKKVTGPVAATCLRVVTERARFLHLCIKTLIMKNLVLFFIPVVLAAAAGCFATGLSLEHEKPGMLVTPLPLQVAVPADLDSMELMKKEIARFENVRFQDKPAVTTYEPTFINGEFIGRGINSSVKFYKRLPDIDQVKVFLFIYLRECHNDDYPAVELQTFDCNNNCIDRLLVAVAVFEEGGLFRYSEVDSNYRISVKDVVVSYDLENDGQEESRVETVCNYGIDNNGFFIAL